MKQDNFHTNMTISIPSETRLKLKQFSDKLKKPMSVIISEALNSWFKKN